MHQERKVVNMTFTIMSASVCYCCFHQGWTIIRLWENAEAVPSSDLDTWIDSSYVRVVIAKGDEVRP
jgi:hypothetical protein